MVEGFSICLIAAYVKDLVKSREHSHLVNSLEQQHTYIYNDIIVENGACLLSISPVLITHVIQQHDSL